MRARAAARRSLAPPRLGFLGVGWIGRHRMEALIASGGAEVAAICDPSAAMANAARALAPEAPVVDGLDALLRSDLDGLVIATPSALHAEQAVRALEAGLAVFCQKPLGRDAVEVETVIAAARRADRLLEVDLSYRHTTAMQVIRRRLQGGAIGRVYAADLVFHNAYGPDKPWFYDRALSGGGCMIDLGTHLVDLVLWTLGDPRVMEVSADLYAGGRPIGAQGAEVEDFATASLRLETGASVRLACSWGLHAGCDAVIAATFHGTEGSLAFSNVGGSFYDFAAEQRRGTRSERLVAPPDAWGGRAALDWLARLSSGAGFDPRVDAILAVSRILDAVYRR